MEIFDTHSTFTFTGEYVRSILQHIITKEKPTRETVHTVEHNGICQRNKYANHAIRGDNERIGAHWREGDKSEKRSARNNSNEEKREEEKSIRNTENRLDSLLLHNFFVVRFVQTTLLDSIAYSFWPFLVSLSARLWPIIINMCVQLPMYSM